MTPAEARRRRGAALKDRGADIPVCRPGYLADKNDLPHAVTTQSLATAGTPWAAGLTPRRPSLFLDGKYQPQSAVHPLRPTTASSIAATSMPGQDRRAPLEVYHPSWSSKTQLSAHAF